MHSIYHWLNEIDITQVDDAENTDIVIPMYNLMECSDVYSKAMEGLWQYCRDETVLDNKQYYWFSW